MEQVKQLQAEGNARYRDGRYGEAGACYSRALALLLPADSRAATCVPDEAETAAQLYANRAQTAIQERDFGAALADATLALQYQPQNEKAVLRKLVALENLERFEAAAALVDEVVDGGGHWGIDRSPTLFQHCLATRRRLRKMLAKDREAAVKEVKQLGKLVHEDQQLRINFGSLLPSRTPLGRFFDVSVNIGNEFGLFRRDYLQDGKRIALQFAAYNRGDESGAFSLVVDGSADGTVELNEHGKAQVRMAINSTNAASDTDSLGTTAIKVSVAESSRAEWDLFPVVSLPIGVVPATDEFQEGDTGVLGIHCCRPIRMPGLDHDILLAESPGSLGIGGKLWDSCLILTRHLSRHRDLLVGKTVVELGSGLGLVGIFCSLLGAHVTLTDIEEVVPLLKYNIELNCPSAATTDRRVRSSAREHLWGSSTSNLPPSPDVIVLSDVVYDPEGYEPLVSSLEALATPATTVLMAHRSRNPMEHHFFERLAQSFTCELTDWASEEAAATQASMSAAVKADECSESSSSHALRDVKIFKISRTPAPCPA